MALNGGQPVPQRPLAEVDKYAECMRASGLPDYPEPNGGGEPVNPDSTAYQNAAKVCRQKLGFFNPVPGGAAIGPRVAQFLARRVLPGSGGAVTTATVVRTNLATTVQVGGSIGYDGSYTCTRTASGLEKRTESNPGAVLQADSTRARSGLTH